MFKKIKQKAKGKGRKLFGISSSAGQSPSISINSSKATTVELPNSVSEPNSLAPPSSLPQVSPSSASQPVITSPIPSSTKVQPPPPQNSDSHVRVVQDPATIQRSSSASAASSVAERSRRKTAWSGLKTLIELLNASADAFGPLKSAVGGISKFIEINDVRIQIRPYVNVVSDISLCSGESCSG